MRKIIKISSLFLMIFFINSTINVKADNMSSWAKADIEKAINLKIVPNKLQNKYTEAITREEFCELVINLLEEKKVDTNNGSVNIENFTDTNNESINKAARLGIVSGVGNGKFNPNGKITRQEAAVMLYNTLDKGSDVISNLILDNKNGINGNFFPHVFNDGNKINNWARNKIYLIYHLGIMFGTNNNNFNPLGTYTREQSISTILRLYNAFDDINNNNMPEPEIYHFGENDKIYSSGRKYYIDAIWNWGNSDFIYEPEYFDGFGNTYTAKEKGYVYPINKKYMDVLVSAGVGVGAHIIIDKNCNEVTDSHYDISFLKDNIVLITNVGGNQSVYNLDTKEYIITDEYDYIGLDKSGLYSVTKNGLHGYLNSEFKEVIPPIYKNTGEFDNNLTVLQKQDDSFVIINTNGEIIKSFNLNLNKYSIYYIYGTNMILKDENGNSILYRANSEISIDEYPEMRFSEDGNIIANKNGKIYLLNKSGKLIVDVTALGYDNIRNSSEMSISSNDFYIVNKIDKSNWSNSLPADIMDYEGNIIRKGINSFEIITDYNGIWAYKSSNNQITLFDAYGKDIGIIKTDFEISSFEFINGILRVISNNENNYYTPNGDKISIK